MSVFTSSFHNPPNKEELCKQFVGKTHNDLPTPALVIDRKIFAENSSNMLRAVSRLQCNFRLHVKTHKTTEGVLLSLGHGLQDSSLPTASRIVVSTMAEAWAMLPLIQDGIINDVLFGLPVAKSKMDELAEFAQHVKVRTLVDSLDQIHHMKEYAQKNGLNWNVYVKLDVGTGRAGVDKSSEEFKAVVDLLLSPEVRDHVVLGGIYCHSGHSYSSEGTVDARKYLLEEISNVNTAAKYVRSLDASLVLDLCVGATPTVHGSQQLTSIKDIESELGEINGNLELHAGNYCCCDLQQLSTGLIEENNLAVYLVAEVLSTYPNRNGQVPGEQLINAGALAVSKDTGRIPGYGKVIRPQNYGSWTLSRVSQEHGILTPQGECSAIPYGEKVHILPQHACIIAAAHPWFYAVEDGVVVDVWVPAKFW